MYRRTDIRVAVDIDGVLYNWSDTARFLLAHYRGVYVSPSTSWDHIQESISPQDWDWLWTEGVELGLFRSGHVYRGAPAGVQELYQLGAKVIIATLRKPKYRWDTLEWLLLHRIPFDEIVFTTSKALLNADIYIDDSPRVAREILDETMALMLLWDQPWNRTMPDLPPRLYRVTDWAVALEHVKEAMEDASAHGR